MRRVRGRWSIGRTSFHLSPHSGSSFPWKPTSRIPASTPASAAGVPISTSVHHSPSSTFRSDSGRREPSWPATRGGVLGTAHREAAAAALHDSEGQPWRLRCHLARLNREERKHGLCRHMCVD